MPNKYLDSVGLAEYTTLIKTALDDKADLSSPALTGTPTAPTPTAGDDSTKIATTEFVQDAIDAEETRADGAYLPLTGGSVTGNLTVSGTITGNVTGNATNDGNGNPIASTYLPLAGGTLTGAVNGVTPTVGDDSTKLATTAFVQDELTTNLQNYLPLAGGTMTGNIVLSSGVMVSNYDNTTAMRFVGGDATNGYAGKPRIALFGNNYSYSPNLAGAFAFVADDSTNNCTLYGYPNGDLKWSSKEVEIVNVYSSTNKYIRYESGLQICWGNVSMPEDGSNVSVSYSVPFAVTPSIGASSVRTRAYRVFADSATGFAASSVSGTGDTNLYYVAIGRWK